MANHISPLVALVIVVTLVVCAAQWLGPYIINYRLNEEGLKIVFLGFIRLVKIRYRDIAKVEILTFKETLLSVAWRFGNRVFVNRAILITQNRFSIFYQILFSPNNFDEFVSELNR